ncbi:hypothetical protein AB0G42_21480 [Streptomyces yangpuensis]|uniref:hypothetical protein n=1 Tax=Streptomyces yangpuensis TaxID=1648182 RepID=UPI003437FBEF
MTAKKNDALGTPHVFEFNGDTYEVPAAEDWDIDVLEAIDDSRMTHALKALLSTEGLPEGQYEKFRAANKKVKDLGEFFTAAGKKAGAGNS